MADFHFFTFGTNRLTILITSLANTHHWSRSMMSSISFSVKASKQLFSTGFSLKSSSKKTNFVVFQKCLCRIEFGLGLISFYAFVENFNEFDLSNVCSKKLPKVHITTMLRRCLLSLYVIFQTLRTVSYSGNRSIFRQQIYQILIMRHFLFWNRFSFISVTDLFLNNFFLCIIQNLTEWI